MSTIGNVFWFFLGGMVMGLSWWLIGVLAYLSIVGIPWGKACFVIGKFSFSPFGREAIDRSALKKRADVGTGLLGLIGNVLWILLGGFWLAVGHLISAALCFLTIIGIPFGVQHLKLSGLSIAPIGKTIVSKEEADAVRC